MPECRRDAQLRVLVVAPIGRDGELTCHVLDGAGIRALCCADMDEGAREVAAGAGALLVTVDALGPADAGRLDGLLRAQEPWSDLPVVLAVALEYGRAGTPVGVEAGAVDDGVRIAVHNEGPAIPPEEQARIFEPFGRGRGAAAVATGWGLGLTLVRGCAEAHGGALAVTSSPEQGTTFTLRLPRDARPYQAG